MLTIPLDQIPNQSLDLSIGGHRWSLRIKQARESMVIDVTMDDALLIAGHRIAVGSPILPYPPMQVAGNFLLLTDGDADPDYSRFGVDQALVYVTPEEIGNGT
ncbi:phage baseplate plug family protein [Azorhizophilus paspali]|uniref:Phage baseplate plug protein n=1 Tax=Azorhizophilus paspali TaxID=69963 RepID=A0ABV6SHJ3_AZOPA